jgi:lysophospholipase L1-like esterase
MKNLFLRSALLLASLAPLVSAEPSAPTGAAPSSTTIPVDSPAFVFSPANWVGDEGRAGKVFRQAWNSGAYFRIQWETKNATPTAKLLLDTSTYATSFKPPKIAYEIDGVWKSSIPCANEIPIDGLKGAGSHELLVCLQSSDQKERWGSEGKSPLNVLRVTGLQVDADSQPVAGHSKSKWALIIGDSITEGIGATELNGYAYLVAQALATEGYDYCLNACGWSGWINRGDNPPGDVPAYYNIQNSTNGTGGKYDDATSRWNKIDGNSHSLLDSRGHISAFGQTSQEPALIFINYGTNDAIHHDDRSDTVASINQGLAAVRASAPDAEVILLIPFGQYFAKELKEAVERRKTAQPADHKIAIIDLGPGVAKNLAAKNGVFGGLHPNDRGCANFAAQIIPQVLDLLRQPTP